MASKKFTYLTTFVTELVHKHLDNGGPTITVVCLSH